MKKLIYFLVIFCMMTMTSCIDIVEEMFLKKDGSGKYVITMDMSSLMEAGTKEMLEGMMQEGVKEGEEKPSLSNMEQDTTMYFSDAPDSIRSKFAHPEILDKVYVKINVSEKNEKMIMTFAIDFDEIKEVDYFLQDIDKLQASNESMPGALGGASGGSASGGLLPSAGKSGLFKLVKRKFTRSASEKPAESMSGEELQMVKMFFADATYKTIYHFPGKVKKTTMKNAKIDGKTLTIETPLMDVLEGKAAMEGDICFKKR